MPNQEITCSPDKWAAWDKPTHTWGYLLVQSGPSENVHIPSSEEVFMAKGSTHLTGVLH